MFSILSIVLVYIVVPGIVESSHLVVNVLCGRCAGVGAQHRLWQRRWPGVVPTRQAALCTDRQQPGPVGRGARPRAAFLKIMKCLKRNHKHNQHVLYM